MLRVADDYFSHSDTGRQRRSNEDSYFARTPVFVVADGMGGAQAGEVASSLAVEAFEAGLGGDGSASTEQLLDERIREANRRIHEMSQADDRHAGMGTTITAAHVDERDVVLAHVGDSRAYLLREGRCERLTDDHSLVEEMRRRGQITAEEADMHPQRSIITRALGPEPEVEVDVARWPVRAGDVYLLCSDGLTSMIAEEQVGDILREHEVLQDAGRALIAAANDAGGRDNITVVLFRLEELDGAGGDLDAQQATSVGRGGLKTADVQAAMASAQAAEARRLKPRPPGPEAQASAPAPRRRSRPRRALTVGLVIAALIIVPLVVGGVLATQAVYFVGADDGLVTVYQGLPYELPGGLRLYGTEYVSGVPVRTLSPLRRERLLDHTLRSRDDAADLVRRLERGELAS